MCALSRLRSATTRCARAEKLASEIADFGFDVVIDDRKERAGVKFADADLIGWPLQVVIGKRGLAEGNVEVKLRRTGQKKDVSLSTIAELLRFAKRNARKHPLWALRWHFE